MLTIPIVNINIMCFPGLEKHYKAQDFNILGMLSPVNRPRTVTEKVTTVQQAS